MFIDGLNLTKDSKKLIIQVAYFDKERNRNEKENKLKDEIKKLEKEKEDEIKKLKKKINQKKMKLKG